MQNLKNIYLFRRYQAVYFKETRTLSLKLSPPEYCMDLIRKYDYENFICTILLRNSSRTVAVAVRSFNVEIARIADQVSQKDIGLMRLKFWAEVVDKCFSKDLKQVPRHPVALELYKAITKANISKRYLRDMVLARQDNMLYSSKFRTMEEIEKYAEKTISGTYYLILEGCGVKNVHADHAASHLGKAQGIVQQLRCIPFIKQLNMIPIPQEILIKNRIREDSFSESKYLTTAISLPQLSDCVYEMATVANQHLQKSQNLKEKVPKDGRIALLPSVPISLYLNRLEASDYNVLDTALQKRPWNLLPTVYFKMLINQY